MNLASIKALTFDVFGTVVDWRTSIALAGEQFGHRRGLQVDWYEFADAWRRGYEPAMDRVRRGLLPWTSIDGLHRIILDQLLEEFDIQGLSTVDKDYLNRVWHRLDPWPDVAGGLARLRRRFVIAALSNGNMALLTNMAKRAALPWDCILSSELARHYKPAPQVYQTAAEMLGLAPGQIGMVAAHIHDLRGAMTVGFKTIFVPRPLEYGPTGHPDLESDPAFDLVASDFYNLAEKLGA